MIEKQVREQILKETDSLLQGGQHTFSFDSRDRLKNKCELQLNNRSRIYIQLSSDDDDPDLEEDDEEEDDNDTFN